MDLLRQSGETPSGRIAYVETRPLDIAVASDVAVAVTVATTRGASENARSN